LATAERSIIGEGHKALLRGTAQPAHNKSWPNSRVFISLICAVKGSTGGKSNLLNEEFCPSG